MKVEIRPHNGTPTLFLDSEPAFAGYLWATAPTTMGYPVADVARAYADAGIHLHAFDVGSVGETPEWAGPGENRQAPTTSPPSRPAMAASSMPTLTRSSTYASTSNCGAVVMTGGWIAIPTSATWIQRASGPRSPSRRRSGGSRATPSSRPTSRTSRPPGSTST